MRRPAGGANIAPVVHDLIIVGAAPAGISTAVEARKAGIGRKRILILEKRPAHSCAIRKFCPEDKRVDALYKGILDQTIQRWQLNVHYADGTLRKQATGVELMSGEPLLKEGGETSTQRA